MHEPIVPTQSSPAPATRRRVLKSGLVLFAERSRTASVMVVEMTEDSARLHCGLGALIPRSFELLIDYDGVIASCEVAWRTDKEIGVRILGTAPAGDPIKRTSGRPKLKKLPPLRIKT